MTVEQKDGNLIITIAIDKRPSKTGKTTIIASTNGNKVTDLKIGDKLLTVGVNCYVSKD